MKARKLYLESMRGRAVSSWLFLGTLFVLCGVLGVLQYRWIGEVSVAARERMRGSLQTSLNRVSQDFNTEISTAARAWMPSGSPADAAEVERGLAANLEHAGHPFSNVAVAVPRDGGITLHMLDVDKRAFRTVKWPDDWKAMQARLTSHLSLGQPQRPDIADESLLFESPVMTRAAESPGSPGLGRREIAWLVFELNLPYVRETVLPEILQHDLGSDYQVQVVAWRQMNPVLGGDVIYESDHQAGVSAVSSDAGVWLLPDSILRP